MRIIKTILPILLMIFSSSIVEGRLSIQEQIDSAVAEGLQAITITPGVYRSQNDRGEHLLLNRLKNISIDASGVTLICETRRRALTLRNCVNVHLKGLTIDYDPLTFSQGTVRAVDDRSVTIEIDHGYPNLDWPKADRVVIHDRKTQRVKPESPTLNIDQIEQLEEGIFRLHNLSPFSGVDLGDAITVWTDCATWNTVLIDQSERSTIEGFLILATSAGWTVRERNSSNMTYRGIQIRPGPKPTGSVEPRLRATHSDGIHSVGARIGPTITDCEFRGLGDDGIAIRGYYGIVTEVQKTPDQVVVVFPDTELLPGPLCVVSKANMEAGEVARIVGVDELETPSGEYLSLIQAHYPKYKYASLYKRVYRITTDRPVEVEIGDLTGHPTQNGNQFEIRGNVIMDTRARGIILKASDGVIEGNRIEHTLLPGILCVSEFKHFIEADFSRNIVISDNQLIDNCLGDLNPYSPKEYGAIVISSESGWKTHKGHRNIKIQNNRIENCAVMGIHLNAVSNVLIEDNWFIGTHDRKVAQLLKFEDAIGSVIFTDYARNVQLRENHWLSPGLYAHRSGPVFTTDYSEDVDEEL